MIDDYLRDLAGRARGAGFDSARLVDEATDHLIEAIGHYEGIGYTHEDARRKAILDFGDPQTIIDAISFSIVGGIMKTKVRAVAVALSLAAVITLVVAHIVPSQDVSGTPFEVIGLAAVGVMLAAGISLLATARPRAPLAAFPLAAFLLWTIASSAAADINLRVGNWWYFGALAGVALLVTALAMLLHIRGALGLGLFLAGLVGLALNGGWNGGWETMGALGDSQGNLAVLLLSGGWVWTAASWSIHWWGQPQARRVRSRLASRLLSIARRLEPDTNT